MMFPGLTRFLFSAVLTSGSDLRYVETKGPTECRDAVNNLFVTGPIGSMTYKESERGNAMDHTSPPVTTTPTPTNPASNLSLHELIVLGFMPARDDFEVEFENDGEILVSGIQACSGGNRVESEDEEVMVILILDLV